MKVKRGVDSSHVHPVLWGALALADAHHIVVTGEPLTVTSLRRQPKAGSRHSPLPEVYCTAADIRRWRLDALEQTESFARWLQATLRLRVLVEPDWMTATQIEARGGLHAIDPHIHAELRGEPNELRFEVTD